MMSTQRGNTKKNGQKYQNTSAYKNNMHDKSKRTQMLNELVITGLCSRCTETVEWKIKYKKYKLLTQPKKCVKCFQRKVKQAYHIVCADCAKQQNLCGKCNKPKDVIHQPRPSSAQQASQDSAMREELRALPERKRRAFFRMQEKGEDVDIAQFQEDDEEHTSSDDEEHTISNDDPSDSKKKDLNEPHRTEITLSETGTVPSST